MRLQREDYIEKSFELLILLRKFVEPFLLKFGDRAASQCLRPSQSYMP